MVTTPNQGPATEPFKPPKLCLSTTTYTAAYSGTPYGFTLGTDLDCFPPPTSGLVSPTTRFVKLYSPGICPVGYTYATPYTESISGQRYDDSITRYICCPDTYTEHRCKGPGSPGGARCLSGMATCHGCRVCRSCQGCRGCRRGREVLIPVGVILVSVAAWLYWLRRKGRLHRGQVPLCCLRARKHGEQHDSEDSGYEKPELHAESLDPQQNPNASSEPQSLAQSGALELHADPIPIREADSRRVVPEVDSKPLPSFQPYVLHPHTASAEKTVQRPSTR